MAEHTTAPMTSSAATETLLDQPVLQASTTTDTRRHLRWSIPAATLVLTVPSDGPVTLSSFRPREPAPTADDGREEPVPTGTPPLVEVLVAGEGRFPGSHRYADTVVGRRLRYLDHGVTRAAADGADQLRVRQRDAVTGLEVTTVLEASGPDAAAVRAWTELHHAGDQPLELQAVTSLVAGTFVVDPGLRVDDLDVLWAENDWIAESRWHRDALRGAGLPEVNTAIHAHASRSRFTVTVRSSWSSGERLPVGVLTDRAERWAVAWQVEHHGAWHSEVGETVGGAYLALLGPTDSEHQWSIELAPGDRWTSIPVALAVAAGGPDDALAALTRHRRTLRRRTQGVERAARTPVVFNDYMNTLMGDPTAATLVPLITAAARTGAEIFVIDAGWYDEDGGWWDSVGRWQESRTRFPDGLGCVLDHIRAVGMIPGLWLEPEVVGVRSPVARELPDAAFFSRRGRRVAEHGRYHLDLRHPAARAHLDEVVDRLVGWGVGFLKIDYNTMAGPGTDVDATSAGDGMLEHQRAHLAWLDAVLARHPQLVVENCASGAMRADYALLARLDLQSTSDQQDPLLYPAIAAAAPAAILPEQCGHWGYAQPGISAEESAFTLATGLAGRLYLSGHVDRMDAAELDLVQEAVTVHRALLPLVTTGIPFWPRPLQAPGDDGWVVAGLRSDPLVQPGTGPAPRAGDGIGDTTVLTLWRTPGAPAAIDVPVPHLRGEAVGVDTVFPVRLPGWELDWDPGAAVLQVRATTLAPAARVVRLVRRAP